MALSHFLLQGLLTTVMLTVVSISLGMLVAIILAAGRLYGRAGSVTCRRNH